MAELVVIDGPNMGRSYPLGEDTTLGRDLDSAILLADRRALARHARIVREGDRWLLRALGDPATVQVNGEAVSERALVHGDVLAVGGVVLLFSEDTRPAPPPRGDEAGSASDPTIQARQKGYVDASSIIQRVEQGGPANQRLATLYRVNHAIGAILDLDPLLEKLLDILFQTFPVERGSIWLVEEAQRELVPRASRTFGARTTREAPRISRTILKEVFRSRESILTQDAMEDQRFKAGASILDMQIRAAMCVPLIYKDEILGVIHVDSSSRTKALTREDLDLLSAIATQAAMVLANARAYARRQEYAEKLKALGVGSRRVSALLSREAILREAVQSAVSVLGCTKASIVLADPETGRLSLSSSVGMERGAAGAGSLAVGRGFCEEVVSSAQPMLVSDVEALRGHRSLEADRRYRSNAFLIVPILRKAEEGPGDGGGEDGGPAHPAGRAMGALSVTDRTNGGGFTEEDQEILSVFAVQVGIALANAELYEQATIDGLTRVYVRHFFFTRLAAEVRRAAQLARPLGLLMLDLDHFKRVNDELGHPAGDLVLRETGAVLQGSIREGRGLVARYGGEEFAVLVPGCDRELLARIGGRVREAVEEHAFRFQDREIRKTVSVGGALLREGEGGEGLIARADACLYRAKEGGRNRVVLEEA
ncbi:MAG: diguanylate cyclase [Planctomycetes bacterium]|nr:diguanylate cyclase [Planctomycetota bacterium]